jgi:hypothetical protein
MRSSMLAAAAAALLLAGSCLADFSWEPCDRDQVSGRWRARRRGAMAVAVAGARDAHDGCSPSAGALHP